MVAVSLKRSAAGLFVIEDNSFIDNQETIKAKLYFKK